MKDAYASGYRGFLSFEPHLSVAGQYSGFSGPELFGVAVDALRKLASENSIPLAILTLAQPLLRFREKQLMRFTENFRECAPRTDSER